MNVWEATVDNNTWKVQVVRTGDYAGRLEVIRASDDEVIYTEDVGLSYGAIFGPDAYDVADWEDKAIKIIDSQ